MRLVRIIGKTKPKRAKIEKIVETPIEALQLAEDLAGMDLAIKLLESIDPTFITDSHTQEQRDFGREMKASTIALIRTWKHYARLTMRRKYLK